MKRLCTSVCCAMLPFFQECEEATGIVGNKTHTPLGHRVPHFRDRDVTGRQHSETKLSKRLSQSYSEKTVLACAVKCVVVKLQGDKSVPCLDGHNCQSPIASVQRTRSTLASHSAVPRGTNVKRTNANRAIRIAAQRTRGL